VCACLCVRLCACVRDAVTEFILNSPSSNDKRMWFKACCLQAREGEREQKEARAGERETNKLQRTATHTATRTFCPSCPFAL